MQRPASSSLPPLDPAASAHSASVARHLRAAIAAAGGWLPFSQWMSAALYAPGLGYYTAGATKLASPADAQGPALPAGDFVTAPELTPLFAATVARQVAQVLRATDTASVLEFGAGTGALAEGVLRALAGMDCPARYLIVEVSADLRQRQQSRLAPFGDRVQWLDQLPDAFAGCVLGNEVLDAMPATLFRWSETGTVQERGVTVDADGAFAWQDRDADAPSRKPWRNACRRCPATYRKSTCKPRPGSAAWACGCNAARRCCWTTDFRAASTTIRNAPAAR